MSDTQLKCIIEDIGLTKELDPYVAALISLNGHSWTATNDDVADTGKTFYVPYSINSMFPPSGPAHGGSQILIVGSGFMDIPDAQPRCRFGAPSNYVITTASILSYNRMTCTAPPSFDLENTPWHYPLQTPFSIALTADAYDPWTSTFHKFRYYKQPKISKIVPSSVEVGTMTEIFALICTEDEDEADCKAKNHFFKPLPNDMHNFDAE